MKYLTLLLLVISFNCAADGIYLGAWSRHNGDHPNSQYFEYHSEHKLLAVEYKGYMIGRFRNSFGQVTAIAGKKYHFYEWNDIQFNLSIGASYGYRSCHREYTAKDVNKLCFALVPEILYDKYRIKPAILVLGDAAAITFKVGF